MTILNGGHGFPLILAEILIVINILTELPLKTYSGLVPLAVICEKVLTFSLIT